MKIELHLPAQVQIGMCLETVVATIKLDTTERTLSVIVPSRDQFGYASQEEFDYKLVPAESEAA